MRLGKCCLPIVAFTALAGPAPAADLHYEGTAYTIAGGAIAYREEHWLSENAGRSERLVLYKCPDGAPFARKTVTGPAGTAAPDFELFDGRDGYREGVRTRGNQREVFFQENAKSPEKSAPLPAATDPVIDAGFDAYVRKHWAKLDEARDLSIPFLIPSRLGYLDLKLAGAGPAAEGDRRLRMSLDAWYGFVAPTLELTYTGPDHRLRRFEGVSNVRDAVGKNQKVRIEFPEASTPASIDVTEARALPLAKRCP